ncbi:MAG TPA: hypothetical protein VEN81_09805 [Planctomycetota bacterium]|nr:hypothetical protein [Planctomycetota bacterium]
MLRVLPIPRLGQASGPVSSGASEPDLNRALAGLSPDEISDYQAWGVPEKTLFFQGYQYLAVASAKGLHRADGAAFDGFFPEGLSTALTIVQIAAKYIPSLGPLSGTVTDLTNLISDGQQNTEPTAQGAVQKYRLLRDRVAWEMANAGVTVQFDIVGDDPANPGVLYQRTIGDNRVADLDAVYSTLSPNEMYRLGKTLEESYATLGVPFQRSLGAAAFPLLAVIITAVVAILGFFYLFWNHQDRAKLNDATITMVQNDTTLSTVQKADILKKLQDSNSFFSAIFGELPWTTLIVMSGIALIALFVLPPLFAKPERSLVRA